MNLLTETTGGIYSIQNPENKKVYIGQTRNFKERSSNHFYLLRNNEHYNVDMQMDYNHGANLKMDIIEVIPKNNWSQLQLKEAYYILKYDSIKRGYNISVPSPDVIKNLIKTGLLVTKNEPHKNKKTIDNFSFTLLLMNMEKEIFDTSNKELRSAILLVTAYLKQYAADKVFSTKQLSEIFSFILKHFTQ
ncbi:MAG: GIY-YIG nuclease family protein [Anaerocolumna aminovalerica]|uniref:GIY-YIG nuclease family protein n=1 Tax=Anaerocolumna aminovalerica TaxID=1527 RepID=UPI002910618A|nr:GIY-YIG nuclease family protein [Anaerocolumna aminovalerica]MDU6263733.1 GIY-YIG nuclease family protein [Anaerocolumna aminovalerica]